MTRDYGQLAANIMGQVNESTPKNLRNINEMRETRRDLHNNKVGRKIALQVGKYASDVQLAKFVAETLKGGCLKVRGTPNAIVTLKEQYNKGKWVTSTEGMWVGNELLIVKNHGSLGNLKYFTIRHAKV